MVNLTGLVYRPRVTRLAQGQCSTVDYVVLLLGNAGTLTYSQIHSAVATWRGLTLSHGTCLRITHLTDASYCYISASYLDTATFAPFGTRRHGLWYRVSRGVYALNAVGRERYRRLASQV